MLNHVVPLCCIVFSFKERKALCFAASSGERLKVNCWGRAAEIFKLTITVSSFHKDSPQVTLFNASQMFWSHGKIFAKASHLLCKLASYHQVTAYKDQFVLFFKEKY